MRLFHGGWGVTILLVCLLASTGGHIPAQQPAGEDAAFLAARAINDPSHRVGALKNFLAQFPAGTHREAARQLLLDAYLSFFPEQVDAIHETAAAQVDAAPAGLQRWLEEARIANLLANAGENGVDLADAERWADEAVHALTEPAFVHESATLQVKYHLPRLPSKELHRQFEHDRMVVIAASANVKLRLGKTAAAAVLLSEARSLGTRSAEVLSLSGQLALDQGDPAKALSEFIQASALGPLPTRWQNRMQVLFAEREHGNAQDLERRIDEAYRTSFSPVFALPRRSLPDGGHPVLLELFTGSDCAPCAAPDLAVDSLLSSYSRDDLIALEYDEHIPQPDPLTNPDGVERANAYGIEATPRAFLDGHPAELLGSSRADTENVVVGLAEQIEDAAALSSALHLQLTTSPGADGRIRCTATLKIARGGTDQSTRDTTGDVSLRSLQRAVLHLALAEDDVRYMGQNGVRFHRMVVRKLEQTSATTLLTQPAQQFQAEFSIADLDANQESYIDEFQAHNDQFGPFQFRTIRIPIRPDHLVVVAWLQDEISKQVLQSAAIPVPSR